MYHKLISALLIAFSIPCIHYYLSISILQTVEICDNAIDDDEDGLIDLNDSDCTCDSTKINSLIPNPSFEELNCCPNSADQFICAKSWIRASGPSTDFLHSCGWAGDPEFLPPLPFPDGDGIVGFRNGSFPIGMPKQPYWKEYVGACLISPIIRGDTFRLEFFLGFIDDLKSPPIEISIFGTGNCQYLPFGTFNPRIGCPLAESEWVKLGAKMISGNNNSTWKKVTIDFIPDMNIAALVIGPPCEDAEVENDNYYFIDNILVDDKKSFENEIKSTGHPCLDTFKLAIPFSNESEYQWYKNKIALVGEKSNFIFPKKHGEGEYIVKSANNNGCFLTSAFTYKLPIIQTSISESFCTGTSYFFGTYEIYSPGTYDKTFTSIQGCDSTVSLTLTEEPPSETDLAIDIFEGEVFQIGGINIREEGNYSITVPSSEGCDSLINLIVNYYNIYIPNIFSPNQDGINDVFEIFGIEHLITGISIAIYDRWGNHIFQGDSWDGISNNSVVQPGVYTYIAEFTTSSNISKIIPGTITVIY
jgi:gliding motility-associated-like protein